MSRVLESDLTPDLKFTLAVLASFADEDGGRIWPSMGEVAYLRGVSERAVQYHVKELRRMEILAIVKPATQWWPAQSQIVFEKLPVRPPYRPPERQPYLLGPPGESPPRERAGVKWASPLPGVKYSVPGVKPTSPDPSLDPPLRTHTPRAREETEHSGVKPASPLAGESPEAALPLIVAPARDPDHAAHAWCGRICVPKFLHRQFKAALGGAVKWRAKRMRAFYTETVAALPTAGPIWTADPMKFWRRAFADRFGGTAPRVRPRSGAGRAGADPDAIPGHDVWSNVLRRIERKVTRHAFHAWFLETVLVADRGSVIEVGPREAAHGDLLCAWITKHHADVVREAMEAERPGTRVDFVAPGAERTSGYGGG